LVPPKVQALGELIVIIVQGCTGSRAGCPISEDTAKYPNNTGYSTDNTPVTNLLLTIYLDNKINKKFPK